MEAQQVAMLLSRISSFDNREVSPQIVLAWRPILAPLDYELAVRAVEAHFADPTMAEVYLGPQHIIGRVKAMTPPAPPPARQLPSRFEQDPARAIRAHEGASLIQGVLDGLEDDRAPLDDDIQGRAIARKRRDQAMSRDNRRAQSLGNALAAGPAGLGLHRDANAEPRRGQHCGRTGCQCTHTEGCDGGWIDNGPPADAGYESVRPCPTCRFAVANILKNEPDRAAAQLAIRTVATSQTGGDDW